MVKDDIEIQNLFICWKAFWPRIKVDHAELLSLSIDMDMEKQSNNSLLYFFPGQACANV